MSTQRRFLPSISCLRALEAVDRLGSAVAAAEDLALTPSAVSRQLKVLEEQMGVTLLVRDGKGLKLTASGERYAHSIRATLDDLAQSSLRLKAGGESNSLNIALPTTFGLHWMWPRIARFLRHHPQILINQSTRLARVDFAREKFDMAVYFGIQDWPGVAYLPLAYDRLVPVAAPALAPAAPTEVAALLNVPLLHLESRPGAWETWFERQAVSPGHLHGMLFDQFLSLQAAAVAGFGAALLPEFLARPEIASGRLVQLGPAQPDPPNDQEGDAMYYLVWPRDHDPDPALARFLDWFRQESEVLD
ncbi:LysR substrate-binding domain-containing protein (plasmid) [Thioclava litoralis]|uniref:LysR substrate-binding domain-containing protein n=1 Tax=Thioclava litoralis TaxID=3076557 RepID=A0ABZ1E4I9_9RHOB|nr:LysR substrate-binding domain-containing protein [Thioclava sp. FTW29]